MECTVVGRGGYLGGGAGGYGEKGNPGEKLMMSSALRERGQFKVEMVTMFSPTATVELVTSVQSRSVGKSTRRSVRETVLHA